MQSVLLMSHIHRIRRTAFARIRVVIFLGLVGLTLVPAIAVANGQEPLEIVISGVDGAVRDNVAAMLALPQGMVRDGRVQPAWARRFAKEAGSRVKQALQPFGYYTPDIETRLEQPSPGNFRLHLDIAPGPPVRISARHLKLAGPGAEEPRLKQQIEAFPLTSGAVLRHDLYEEAKGDLLASALALGYIEADYRTHKITVDRDTLQADLELVLATGAKHFFGAVTLLGADTYPSSLLRRHLTFSEGQAFDQTQLTRTQANLLDTDKFRMVRVFADRDRVENHRVPVVIEVDPVPRFQLRPGIGYGTDTGTRVSLRFRDHNVFHLGHDFQADLMIAERSQQLSGHYLVPLANRSDSVMAVSAEYERDDNDSFESSSLATEASLTYGLAKGYKATLFLRLGQEEYQFGSEPSRTSTLVTPGVRVGLRKWTFYKPGRVRSGYAWQAELRGSSINLGSDVSSLQALLGGNTIIRISPRSQLILRAEGGTTWQNEFDDLPPSMRFFAGGDQSVRGYAYQSLGPKDDRGEVIGGQHMLVGSIELETAITDAWGLALFYDAGNAFDSFNNYEMAQGGGLGIRRYTPIGPIKLDLARQLDNQKNYRVHLSVGFGW